MKTDLYCHRLSWTEVFNLTQNWPLWRHYTLIVVTMDNDTKTGRRLLFRGIVLLNWAAVIRQSHNKSTLLTLWCHSCHMSTAIKHPVPDRVKPSFVILTSGHSDAQSWASECPDVKNNKWRLNPVWHRMLYSYGKGLTTDTDLTHIHAYSSNA